MVLFNALRIFTTFSVRCHRRGLPSTRGLKMAAELFGDGMIKRISTYEG